MDITLMLSADKKDNEKSRIKLKNIYAFRDLLFLI